MANATILFVEKLTYVSFKYFFTFRTNQCIQTKYFAVANAGKNSFTGMLFYEL
jgi:hypothetical protein